MAKFKALQSDKQFFNHKGRRYKAVMGFFSTEDESVIDACLAREDAWALIEGVKKVEKVEDEEVKKPSKRNK